MDRLSAMKSARRLFNGPLRKCSSKTAAVDYRRASVSPSYAAARTFSADTGRNAPPSAGSKILESPFGSVKPVDCTLPDYIWRDVDKWSDKPMIVSRPYSHCMLAVFLIERLKQKKIRTGVSSATRGEQFVITNTCWGVFFFFKFHPPHTANNESRNLCRRFFTGFNCIIYLITLQTIFYILVYKYKDGRRGH